MMKKSTLLTMVIFLIAILIYSCDKDEFSEADAYEYTQKIKQMEADAMAQEAELHYEYLQDSLALVEKLDSLERLGGIIHYAVHVVGAVDAGFNKSANKVPYLDAKVTINQNGRRFTQMTGNEGIVVFTDLRIGTVSVNVQVDGYTEVDFVAELAPEWAMDDDNWLKPHTADYSIPLDKDYYGVKRQITTMVPVFPMEGPSMSTIKGRVTYETNLVNNEPEVAAGVEVRAMIDTKDEYFQNKYMINDGMFVGEGESCQECINGKIIDIAYSSIVARDNGERYNGELTNVTNEDGFYALRVPSTADGLPLRIEIDEVDGTQKLLLNRVGDEYKQHLQSIRTIWATNEDDFNGMVSDIPIVPPAYVVFSEPEAVTSLAPAVEATASLVFGKSGIEIISLTERGECYTEPPLVRISQAGCCGVDNISAKATAILDEGTITDVIIDDEGSGYRANESVTVEFVPYDGGAEASAIITSSIIDEDLAKTNFKLKHGYTYKPAPSVLSDYGSGLEVTAEMQKYIDEIKILDAGEGFVTKPDVFIISEGTAIATNANGTVENGVDVDLTTENPILDIELTDAYAADHRFVDPVIRITGSGTGANAYPVLAEKGSVVRIVITNPGSGYDPDHMPSVQIIGDGDVASAVVTDLDVNFGVETIEIFNDGFNYTEGNTRVVIGAPPAGGTQAEAIVTIGYELTDIVVVDDGAGYTEGNVNVEIIDDNEGTVMLLAADYDVIFNKSISAISVPAIDYDFEGKNPEIIIVPKEENAQNATAELVMKYRVQDIMVTDGGAGYRPMEFPVYISFPAAPNGNTPSARVDWDSVDDENMTGVLSFSVTDMGTGYSAKPNVVVKTDNETVLTEAAINGFGSVVSIDDVTGIQANSDLDEVIITTHCKDAAVGMAKVWDNAGQINDIVITNPGAGYEVEPAVVISLDPDFNGSGDNPTPGTNFEGRAVLQNGRIVDVIIDNPGFGYYQYDNLKYQVKFIIPQATTRAVGLVQVENGQIVGVTFKNNLDYQNLTQGEGYLKPPTIDFFSTLPGVGKGAAATAKVDAEGKVVEILMTNKGQGYYAKNNFANDYDGGTGIMGTPNATDTPDDGTGRGFKVYPTDSNVSGQDGKTTAGGRGFSLLSVGGKVYVRDIDLGTGLRMDFDHLYSSHND